MSEVHVITRFVAYFPDAGERGQGELAHAAGGLGGGDLRVLRREPFLLAVNGRAAVDTASALLDVFPGTAASARLAVANFGAARRPDEVHRQAETAAQCYNLLQLSEREFVLESDALGLKPAYVAETRGGTLLASRIADMLYLFPALATPVDAVAVYEMLRFWAPLAERTLHRRICRTLPGGRYRWAPGAGFSGERARDLRPVAVKPQWLPDQAIEAIRDAAGLSLHEKVAGIAQPLLLALSGGYDSRFIAALCRDRQVHVRAVTFGRRHHTEMRTTRAVAHALGLELQTLRQRHNATMRFLPQYLDATEGTADPAAAAVLHLLDASAHKGDALLHGFCGDVAAGVRVRDFRAAELASPQSLATAIMRRVYPPMRPDLTGMLRAVVDTDEVRADVLAGLRRDCPPLQAYQLWFLENRTRRYVATHCATLGEHFDMVMPFYDRRLLDVWQSIAPIALADRAVFKRLLAQYYPALARIPHSEEAAPVTPNLRWQLARFGHNLPARFLAAGVGAQRANELRLRLYRHSTFRTLSKLEAPQQQARLLAELDHLRPVLAQELGLELSTHYAAVATRDSQALRTLWGIARYAERLAARRKHDEAS